MKNGQKNKILMLLGMMDEFLLKPNEKTNISILLKSGKNSFTAEIFPSPKNHGNYIFNGLGKKEEVKSLDLKQMLVDEVILYDEAEIIFTGKSVSKKIHANDKNITIKDVKTTLENKASLINDTNIGDDNIYSGVSSKREYFIKVNEASDLLKKIGIIDENKKLISDKIRKYNQIDRFVEFSDPILRNAVLSNEKITVLDLACGKSYLSFVLYYYITEKLGSACEITGLDRMESVIKSSKGIADSLGYKNMKFIAADLEKYQHSGNRPTLCISLHACDTATDYALYAAVKAKAKAILFVPCCHRELLVKKFEIPELSKTIFRHSAIKEKFSALFTESLRILLLESCGYKASVTEYVSPLDTPKNLLIKAVYQGNKNEAIRASQEYENLKDLYGCDITLGNLLEM